MGIAAAQVALELAGDRVAAGLGQLGLRLALLERAHVLGDVGVAGGQLVDLALPGAGPLDQIAAAARRCRAGPRPGAAAPGWPWGRAAARRNAAPPPRTTPRAARRSGRPRRRRRRCRSGPRSGSSRRSSAAAVAASLAVPLTGTGRVCGVSASSAPRVATRSISSAWAPSMSSSQKPRQRMLGSSPRSTTRSRLASGSRATLRRVVGHSMRRAPPSIERHARPVDLEVVVVVRVDHADRAGVEDLFEVLDRGRGSVGGVVPSFEGSHQHGPAQLADVRELDHGHLPPAASAAGVVPGPLIRGRWLKRYVVQPSGAGR